jgi:gliding motility-associated-like protein
MKTLLALSLAFTWISYAYSQLPAANVCLGTDASVCQGQNVVINQCNGTGTGIYLNNPTQVTFQDDNYSGAINMGFSFNFYGNNYSQIVLGSNGILTFDLAQANGFCPWSSAALPTTNAGTSNSISLSWQDLYFPFAGGLVYQTIGNAPNRQFVVSYENVSYFSASCQSPADCFTASLVLSEGTNTIDMYLSNKSFCLAWNNGLAVQGIQSINGANFMAVPGRNNTAWGAQMDGQRFTPVSSNSYALSNIPFTFISSSVSTTTKWENTLGQIFPYVNGLPLTVTSVPSGTTGYFLTAATCGAAIASISDTTYITLLTSSVSASMTPDVCNLSVGTVSATPVTGTAPYTYSWTNGPTVVGTTQNISNLPVGTYTVTMTTADLCASTASVNITSPTITFVSTNTSVSCPGGADGTSTATMSPIAPGMTYLWNDPSAQTTATATNLSAGTYQCTISTPTGCSGTTQTTISEIPGMILSIVSQQDVPCHYGQNGMVEVQVQQGTPGYIYQWDKSNSTTNIASNLSAGINTVFVTDVNGCSANLSASVLEPSPLSINFLTPDTVLCPENDITLSITGVGGSSSYTYKWTENGVPIGTGPSILVNPSFSGTTYCISLGETCGSPAVDSCLTITFPTPITPGISPNQIAACTPSTFDFQNNSAPASEILSTVYDFGDGTSKTETGINASSHSYLFPNSYSITVTVQSIHNCVYTSTFTNLVQSLPIPTASFNIVTNPTTIFETSIQMQENSSQDVVSWQWYAPSATPNSSNLQNPTFNFPDGVADSYPIYLYVYSAEGCMDSIEKSLTVTSDVLFYAPNAFTPDGDNYNQTWKIAVDGIDLSQFQLSIYNRWGEMVWVSTDVTNEWDGTYKNQPMPVGTYNWVATVKDSHSDKKRQFTGNIALIR